MYLLAVDGIISQLKWVSYFLEKQVLNMIDYKLY